MDPDEPLEIVGDLVHRDADGRVRLAPELVTDDFVVGRAVVMHDLPRPSPQGAAVGAGNLRAHGVLEQAEDGAWRVTVTAIQVDG